MDRANLLCQFLINNREDNTAEAAYTAHALAEEIESDGCLSEDEIRDALSQYTAEVDEE